MLLFFRVVIVPALHPKPGVTPFFILRECGASVAGGAFPGTDIQRGNYVQHLGILHTSPKQQHYRCVSTAHFLPS
jgi:hypothetical protein